MGVTIGAVALKYGLMLAPMAGVTDRTFRLLCRHLGAEYTVSEMVSAKALCYEQNGKRKESVLSGSAPLAAVTRAESPMAVQLFGSEPAFMAEAARMLESGDYRGCCSDTAPTAIDINMGCPVRKITGNGEGSALMKTPELAADIVAAVRRAVRLPVTVKIRAGWDAATVNAPELAKRLEQAGADLICVHARTREQLYAPGIDLEVIERTKRAVQVPVIGNGDISSAEDAIHMMAQTGCDGVMIGRGAMGNPWLFAETVAAMEGQTYTPPTLEERIRTAMEHLDGMLRHKGDRVGLAEAKKHMAWYLSGIRGAAAARGRIMTAEAPEDIRRIMLGLIAQNEATFN
ncbi:MAG: tRNA dihydrouridine synthase DusB [Ruminococcaceae bacterium]|nr:tRNA dihydrouridine synthase DusB [Oscillospiraceae bacterium]